MRNESDVKKKVRSIFAQHAGEHLWYFMPSANGYGRAGIPDFVGTFMGRSFAVETKYGGNTTTAHQANEIAALSRAGATVWVVDENNWATFQDQFRNFCIASLLIAEEQRKH